MNTSRQITAKKDSSLFFYRSISVAGCRFNFLFFSFLLRDFAYNWLIFIYALIPSFILLVVWTSIYHLCLGLLLSISGLIWTSALSIFLSFALMFPFPNSYLIFIIGIPLQVLAILWYLLRKTIKENKKTLVK